MVRIWGNPVAEEVVKRRARRRRRKRLLEYTVFV
jgi:hypothetical protein